VLNASRFEQGIAKAGIDADDVLSLLDYPKQKAVVICITTALLC
jgi:hypothetical protein